MIHAHNAAPESGDAAVAAIERNDATVQDVRFISDITEGADQEALRLGRALRNNTSVTKIYILSRNREGINEFVSEPQYLDGVLHFIQHGPSLRECYLSCLQSSWESTLRAATSNPSVNYLAVEKLDRRVDNLNLQYLEKLRINFESPPQQWFIHALHTASNLRSIEFVMLPGFDDPRDLTAIFQSMTPCPLVSEVLISVPPRVFMNRQNREESQNQAREVFFLISQNFPSLDTLRLGGFPIDANTFSISSNIRQLSLHGNCVVEATPPQGTISCLKLHGRNRYSHPVTREAFVRSQLQTLLPTLHSTMRFNVAVNVLAVLPNEIQLRVYPHAIRVFYEKQELLDALDEHMRIKRDPNATFPPGYCPIEEWDVSRIDDFSGLCDWRRNPLMQHFNEDLSRWNVSNGRSFRFMFGGCKRFHADLSQWNVANATDLSFMFYCCDRFNADLSQWNVSNATNFDSMFYCCDRFNADLSQWNVSNATNFDSMFYGCVHFNADLSQWNVSSAFSLSSMFFDCQSFSSDLLQWEVANATDLSFMFYGCQSFNADLSQWNVANATKLRSMFRGCRSFNADLSQWNVATTDVSYMFSGCTSFNREYAPTQV